MAAAFGAVASVVSGAIGALVVAVLEAFLDLATPEQTRMRHLAVDKLLSRLSLPLLPVDAEAADEETAAPAKGRRMPCGSTAAGVRSRRG